MNESIQYNNDDSSIIVANTIEERDDSLQGTLEDSKKTPAKTRKTIGHYSIGNLHTSYFLEKSIGEGTFGKVKLGTH